MNYDFVNNENENMELQVINQNLLNSVIEKAKASPRLRINYNLHSDLNDKCQRLLNAMEPGTIMPIHHHKVAEVYILLQGRIRVMTYDEKGKENSSVILDPKEGNYGVQILENTWHSLEVIESGSVIFEVKEGPYIPHEIGGMLNIEK